MDIKIECLVVQKQFGKQGQVLAIKLVRPSIHHVNFVDTLGVNNRAWRLLALAGLVVIHKTLHFSNVL